MDIKIYNCFHDHGSKPESKYLSNIRPSLLCGANVKWRGTDSISCDLRDNTGDNISEENEEYSELTGYYWIWKNDTADVVGIEHYRRHFLQKLNIENDVVQTSDLLTDKDICNILKTNDFIIPLHDSLCDINVYDLYKICFNDFADDIVKNMKRYFVNNNLTNYLDSFYNYMSHNYLIRGNMLITTKSKFDEYCNVMFNMINYMKPRMGLNSFGRTWGYITELFPKIFIDANGYSFKEMPVAIDDCDEDGNKRVTIVKANENALLKKDPVILINYLKSL